MCSIPFRSRCTHQNYYNYLNCRITVVHEIFWIFHMLGTVLCGVSSLRTTICVITDTAVFWNCAAEWLLRRLKRFLVTITTVAVGTSVSEHPWSIAYNIVLSSKTGIFTAARSVRYLASRNQRLRYNIVHSRPRKPCNTTLFKAMRLLVSF